MKNISINNQEEEITLDSLLNAVEEIGEWPVSQPLNGATAFTMNPRTHDRLSGHLHMFFNHGQVVTNDYIPDDIIIGWRLNKLHLPEMCLWIGPEKEESEEQCPGS